MGSRARAFRQALMVVIAIATLGAGPGALSVLATEPIATTLTIQQDPVYVYAGELVTVTATVVPNPGSGTMWLYLGSVSSQHAIDPATGTVQVAFLAIPGVGGGFHVGAEFPGNAGFAASAASANLDIRYLPNVVITASPSPATNEASATIEFVTSPDIATSCRLDDDAFAACTSPAELSGLAEGEHTFQVLPYAADGHPGQIGSTTWFTDMTGPEPGDVTLDGGATSTNQSDVSLEAAAADALSGIVSYRVSSTGRTDTSGRLVLGEGAFPDAFDRPWTYGPTVNWHPDPSGGSGPRTVYVQWTDAAGNHSSIVSRTINLRIAAVVLASGAWQTSSSLVAFGLDGIDPSEVTSVLISNRAHFADGRLVEAIESATVPSTWDLENDAAGGTAGRGSKVVYAQWKDARGRWSNVIGQAIADRPLNPVDVEFDEGNMTASPVVHASFVVADLKEQHINVAYSFSCDGVTWSGGALGPSSPLRLDDAAAGCSPTDGARSVHLRWHLLDCCVAGAAELPERIVAITWDSTAPPAPTAQEQRLAGAGTGLVGGAAPVVVSWTAQTGAHFQIRQSTDSGPFGTATTLTSARLVRSLSPGHTYRFSVRAVDDSGKAGAWAPGSAYRVAAVSQSSSAVHYRGTWKTSTSTAWWGGTARSSSSVGSTASYTFTGKSIAWIGVKAATRGKAAVYVNGVLKATVDLYSKTTLKGRILWSASYATTATRTITIRVLGTPGRPRVDVDGFLVGI